MGPARNDKIFYIVGGIILILLLYSILNGTENKETSKFEDKSGNNKSRHEDRYKRKDDDDFTRYKDDTYRSKQGNNQSSYNHNDASPNNHNNNDTTSKDHIKTKTTTDDHNNNIDSPYFQQNIKYLKKDWRFDIVVTEIITEHKDIKNRSILRALLYCEKAVTCMPKDLIKMIAVSFQNNFKDENKIKHIYVSKEEVDIVFDYFANERIRLGSDNRYIIKNTLIGTLNYVRELYKNILYGHNLQHIIGIPSIAVKYNQKLIEIMKNSISDAFPKDVVDCMFKKWILIQDIDYAFSPLELHFFYNVSIALSND